MGVVNWMRDHNDCVWMICIPSRLSHDIASASFFAHINRSINQLPLSSLLREGKLI